MMDALTVDGALLRKVKAAVACRTRSYLRLPDDIRGFTKLGFVKHQLLAVRRTNEQHRKKVCFLTTVGQVHSLDIKSGRAKPERSRTVWHDSISFGMTHEPVGQSCLILR